VSQNSAYWRANRYQDPGTEPSPTSPYRDLPKNQADRFKLLRQRLRAEKGIAERVRFMGEKWLWAWEYDLGSRKLCWIHVMKDSVGVTFTLTDNEAREVEALSRVPAVIIKSIRSGQQTGPVRWCWMEIGDKKAAEAFLAFARKKIQWLKAETPTLVVKRGAKSR